MLFLALAIACSIGTAALLKVVEIHDMRRMPVLAVNYAAGFGLALAIARGGMSALAPNALLLGVATGALFLAGYFVFGAAIRGAGVGLATGVMRLSVAIPVLGAWALFAEVPTMAQSVGLVVAGGAFLLLARPADSRGPRATRTGAAAVLLLLFAVGGCVDLAMKVFARTFGQVIGEPAFLVVVFGTAAILAVLAMIVRGAGPRVVRPEVAIGIAVGVINYASADFILRAAAVMPAALVFPTLSISVMAGTVALGLIIWNERMSWLNVAGLFLAAVALALLWGGGGVPE